MGLHFSYYCYQFSAIQGEMVLRSMFSRENSQRQNIFFSDKRYFLGDWNLIIFFNFLKHGESGNEMLFFAEYIFISNVFERTNLFNMIDFLCYQSIVFEKQQK